MTPPAEPSALLALDTSSPVVSVALARGGAVVAARSGAQRQSSAHLLRWIDEVLVEAGLVPGDLGGVVALAGPGSFTGLRVGLATALGLHQALGLRAGVFPTLGVLAATAPPARLPLCVVPALPGEWFAQVWRRGWPPEPLGEPRRVPTAGLGALLDVVPEGAGEPLLVGAPGVDLADASHATGLDSSTAGELAPVAARLALAHPPDWDARGLTAPLYLAPPPVTLAAAPKRVLPTGRGGG